uniref:Small ribosomal subunit protein uS2c n=2 Tax=Ulva TaxID=3118 RepID=A0A8K1SUL5_9CHLO|nr:30s ribosomal protein S2 [Ulva flexuosa]YP_010530083.1 ribosomal protein S2 [Ulva torta]YP_010835476.1 ribosomal protein S2 [Ulva aragoensis]UEN67829.1 ribosomal protein S2 [Ulva californica]ARO34766.1 30s ribosomal protein S2 [Ulva flexuosa]UFQ87350.1 ribosomal protein S2 [Ulva torta]UXW92181.1 ribosomal protein S2 [Ulva torta]WFS79944.1 ribosomal protein S2 [Ulva aragoensis]
MAITLEQMVQAGMHLGHPARKWNPKMKPFIYTEKDSIHLIDLIKTYVHLNYVCKFLTKSASNGKKILFVGTKKQASNLIAETALNCNSFYVNEKWLGGMLTNWKTVYLSTKKLKNLEIQEKKGLFNKLPKKEAANLIKKKEKLNKYLGGMKNMEVLPDIVIIIGQHEEINALKECNKLGIRSISILDTDCDPSISDLIVPANDDSMPSIKLLLQEFEFSIKQGQEIFNTKKNMK